MRKLDIIYVILDEWNVEHRFSAIKRRNGGIEVEKSVRKSWNKQNWFKDLLPVLAHRGGRLAEMNLVITLLYDQFIKIIELEDFTLIMKYFRRTVTFHQHFRWFRNVFFTPLLPSPSPHPHILYSPFHIVLISFRRAL